MFKYHNLPETIPEKILEKFLQKNGFACFAKYENDSFYTGITNDLIKRFNNHKKGKERVIPK